MSRLNNLALLGLVLASASLTNAEGIYAKNSPVLQVTAKTYDSLLAQSNYTSILEFYAPWCGHCQNLKPAYEKAAKNLAGLAKVAAINCDDDANKPFCGQMGVQGFPTLKIVKPSNKPGKPVVEDYQGQRSAKAIVDAVVDRIPNHVKKLQDSTLDAWLADAATPAKAIVFSEKSVVSALVKSLAVDFLGSISVAQMKSKEDESVKKYGITKFPSIVLLRGSEEPVVYSDEMKKEELVTFLSQAAAPNPDPAPKKVTSTKAKDAKANSKTSKESASFSSASAAHKSSDFDDYLGASTIILDDETPTESPLPIVEPAETPIVIPEAVPRIPILSTPAELDAACLEPKSGTCILVLLPPRPDPEVVLPDSSNQALLAFAEVHNQHVKRREKMFPFYEIPAENERSITLRSVLGLGAGPDPEIIAMNNKRKWWRRYSATGYESKDAADFVDSIILGEGSKNKLPFIPAMSPATEEPEPEPVVPPQPEHNEL